MKTYTISFGLGALATAVVAVPLEASTANDDSTRTFRPGVNPFEQEIEFVTLEEFTDPHDAPIVDYAELHREILRKYPNANIEARPNDICKEMSVDCVDARNGCVEPYWICASVTPTSVPTLGPGWAARELSSSPRDATEPSWWGPMNPYDQQIEHVSSDEYEASSGGPPIPFSEIVRRIHLEHPAEAYEARPNVACKEIKPACVNAFLCPLPYWLCAEKPELFYASDNGHLWPNITFVNEERFDEQPGEALPLKYLWTLEKGIHPGVLFEVEYSGEYAGINETTPCMGVVIDCLAGPPCWRSQWTCQKPTYTITDENGTHIHNETLHWDGEENVEVLKRDLAAGITTVTDAQSTITVHPTITMKKQPILEYSFYHTTTKTGSTVTETFHPTLTKTGYNTFETIHPTITRTGYNIIKTIHPTGTTTGYTIYSTTHPTVTVQGQEIYVTEHPTITVQGEEYYHTIHRTYTVGGTYVEVTVTPTYTKEGAYVVETVTPTYTEEGSYVITTVTPTITETGLPSVTTIHPTITETGFPAGTQTVLPTVTATVTITRY